MLSVEWGGDEEEAWRRAKWLPNPPTSVGSLITVLTVEVVQRHQILDKCGRWS